MQSTLPIPKLHREHLQWINELNFYSEELLILEGHMEKYCASNSVDKEADALKCFRIRFNDIKQMIDDLKIELYKEEKQLISFIKEVSGMGLDSINMDNHLLSRERMKSLRKDYNELKQDFRLRDMR